MSRHTRSEYVISEALRNTQQQQTRARKASTSQRRALSVDTLARTAVVVCIVAFIVKSI